MDEYRKMLSKSCEVLYRDMDLLVTKLLQARREHNESLERSVHILMEGMVCASMQQLRCVMDYLKDEKSNR